MASEDDIPTPPFVKPVSQRDSFQDDSADYNEQPPADVPSPGGTYVSGYIKSTTPEDHQRRVPNVPFSVPVSKKNRLVPRYEVEGTPAASNNTDSSSSGGGGGGGGTPDPSILTQLQIFQSMFDCFNIVCDESGTLSWSFDCDDS